MPLSEETCGIIKVYTSYGFQYMHADELKDVEKRAKRLFNQVNPPAGSVAEWSYNVEAAGLQCGVLFILRGGHAGRGELTINANAFRRVSFSVEWSLSCFLVFHTSQWTVQDSVDETNCLKLGWN